MSDDNVKINGEFYKLRLDYSRSPEWYAFVIDVYVNDPMPDEFDVGSITALIPGQYPGAKEPLLRENFGFCNIDRIMGTNP